MNLLPAQAGVTSRATGRPRSTGRAHACVDSSKVPSREGVAGASFQISLKCFREQFIWQRDICHQAPRFEFVCVNGFAGVVLREARAEITGATDVGLLGVVYASKDIHVEHPPSPLPASANWVQPAFACRTRIGKS